MIVPTARTDVAFGRYALRHYRTVHVEAGAVLQNLYLTAETTGLAGCSLSTTSASPWSRSCSASEPANER